MIALNDAQRTPRYVLWLGGSTAVVAGMVNVCSVIAFFAFASNVTGHVAIFAEELIKGHWHQMSVVAAWVGLFVAGAFVGNLLVGVVGSRSHAGGRVAPLVLEMIVLCAVGYYGEVHYAETLAETEYLVGLLLFGMGLHNGTVATISKGVVKTTHLTGLSTDLGVEIAQLVQGRLRDDEALAFKLRLHLVILACYVGGGLAGGALFLQAGFQSFYAATVMIAAVLVHDAVIYLRTEASREGSRRGLPVWQTARSGEASSRDESAG